MHTNYCSNGKGKKKKTRRVSFILNTVKLFSQKNNTVRYFIYTFTPHSYVKTRRLQITEEMISSLHLQVDLQLTQFLYIISKSSESSIKLNSNFQYFSQEVTILTFNMDSKCIIKNHHKFHNIEIVRNAFTKESKNGHEKQKQILNI